MQMIGGVQNVRNQNGLIIVPRTANLNANQNVTGNVVAAHYEGNGNGTMKFRYGVTTVEDWQALTSGTQIDKAPVYDSDGSAENDSDVISAVSNVEQGRGTAEQNHAIVEETRDLYDSLYNNLAIEAEKVNTVNRKMKETNAKLTTKLARYKNQEKCFEINKKKYDKLEMCYQKSVYQEQCLTKKINAFHLSSTKTITTLNEEIANLNNQLLKEKSTVFSLQEEKKRLKSNFTIREGELLDRQIQLQNKTKELDNILVKTGCSKHMTGNLKLLINFVWKFLGTIRFGNDHVAAMLGYGDHQLGNILITSVYFVEGLGHNLFSVGQFCNSDLEFTFRRNTCFVKNLKGVDLFKGNRTTNLYTINLYEMASASPIFLMGRTTSTKSWLWHQRLSHLNIDTINNLAKNDLVIGLPKLKYHKEHLCLSCEQGKSKKASHPPKPVLNSKQRLHLLHLDLCGLMRVKSINGKRYVLVIVDNYSRYTWNTSTKWSREMKKLDVRTTLIFSRAPLFLWDEAIATACYSQNCFIIQCRFNKTPYELINGRKPNVSFLHVFEALFYPKNDREDIGKLGAKGDIGFFIGYFDNSRAYRVSNQRIKKIMETMNVTFDELSAMDFEQSSSKLGLQGMTSRQISSGLDLTYAPSTITSQKLTERELDLLFKSMYDDYICGQPSTATRTAPAAQTPQVLQTLTTSTTTANTTSTPTYSSSLATNIPNTLYDVDELESQQQHI
nr:integrase, catalytic region, zinc finger, CCHC-type, peptidase aspartic, catalytic [Tanacetum cinerariifolium]